MLSNHLSMYVVGAVAVAAVVVFQRAEIVGRTEDVKFNAFRHKNSLPIGKRNLLWILGGCRSGISA